MCQNLFTALRTLDDAGPDGFEGLVKALLDGFAPDLGIAFLSKSGWQGGVDASSAGVGRTWAGLECKHYEVGSSPRTVDVTGGLDVAITGARNQLDVWILVTTGAVTPNTIIQLGETGCRAATEVVVIDWQQAGLPNLAVLCAANRDLSLRELAHRLPGMDSVAIAADLQALAVHPGFDVIRNRLREQLAAPSLGLATARKTANTWIETRLASEKNARAKFQQPLCPLDTAYATPVDRKEIREALDAWYDGWGTFPACAVVHGREGAGKSWAALDWWHRRTERPLTLLITSNMVLSSLDPLDLLSEALDRQLGKREPGFWRGRLERWLRRPADAVPMILVIFDGLNERFGEDWCSRLTSFSGEELVGHTALLVTLWTSFWEKRVKDFLPYGDVFPINLLPVPLYDDNELAQALAGAKVDSRTLNERTRDILRIPRVCHAAAQRFPHLIATSDLTVERMLVTDWSHRLNVKSGLVHNDQQFNQLIINAARERRAGVAAFARDRLREYSSVARISPSRDLEREFDEIIAGDLFEVYDDFSDTWRIRENHVGLALGMLLADEIRVAERQGADAVELALAKPLEPFTDFSQAGEVLRGAVAAACTWKGYPPSLLRALLRAWLRLRNRPEEHHDDFQAYLPDQPATYFDVAEDVWSVQDEYPAGREWLTAAILHHLDRDAVFDVARQQSSRWLGRWSRDGHPALSGHDDEKRHQQLSDRLTGATDAERRLIADCLHETTEAGQVWLADFALLILSHRPHFDAVDDIAAWALSRAIMGYAPEQEKVAWRLRFGRISTDQIEAMVFAWVDRLLNGTGELGRNAAWKLLFSLGTKVAFQRLDEVGGVRQGERWVREFWPEALEPGSVAPDIAWALESVNKLDPIQVHANFSHSEADQTFEDLEKGLAAYAPGEGAAFIRKMLSTAQDREFLPLRQLSWKAPGHGILVGQPEIVAMNEARKRLLMPTPTGKEREWSFVESHLLLAILPALKPEDRWRFLAERPHDTLMLIDLEHAFGTLPPLACNALLQDLTEESEFAKISAALWFLSRQEFSLDDAARTALIRCFNHDDRLIRLLAFKVAVGSKDDEALEHHRRSAWGFREDENGRVENFYGTLALGSGSCVIRYEDLRGRATPELLGWIAERDGSDAAFQSFAEDLDAIWRTLTKVGIDLTGSFIVEAVRQDGGFPVQSSLSTSDVHKAATRALTILTASSAQDWAEAFRQATDPNVFERREEDAQAQLQQLLAQARAEGMRSFGHAMRHNGFRQALALRLDLVERWLSALETDGGSRILSHAGEFYRQLAIHLMTVDPPRGVALLRRLRATPGVMTVRYAPLGIEALIYAAFDVPNSEAVSALRDEMLDDAVTDEALFVLALVAQNTGNAGWLAEVIDRDASSDVLYLEARALTLIGWLDEGDELDRLRPLLEGCVGFLSNVAETANSRLTRNRRAHHWFGEFLRRRDPDFAWGALRLFLRCVDRRYHLWRWKEINSTPDLPDRWRETICQNRAAITHAITENEKSSKALEDQLFGAKITKGEVYPWVSSH